MFSNGSFCACEFEEERRLFFPYAGGCRASQIDHLHLHLIHNLHGGNRNACLHDSSSSRGRIADAREGDDSHRKVFRDDG